MFVKGKILNYHTLVTKLSPMGGWVKPLTHIYEKVISEILYPFKGFGRSYLFLEIFYGKRTYRRGISHTNFIPWTTTPHGGFYINNRRKVLNRTKSFQESYFTLNLLLQCPVSAGKSSPFGTSGVVVQEPRHIYFHIWYGCYNKHTMLLR